MIKMEIVPYAPIDFKLLGLNIRRIRKFLGLSRNDFNRVTGMGLPALIRLEKDDPVNCWLTTLDKILHVFNAVMKQRSQLTIDDLINTKVDITKLRKRDN